MRATCVLPDDDTDCQTGLARTPAVKVVVVSTDRVCRCGSPVRAIGRAKIILHGVTIHVEITPDGMRLPDGVTIHPAVLRRVAAETERAWAEGMLARWAERRGACR